MMKIKGVLSFLLLFFAGLFVMAQTKTITGKVSSADGPLPGATISVKGTTTGVTADADGKYSITVDQSATTLVFKFIGFIAQEKEIGSSSSIDVTMELDALNLKEVVVDALGFERDRNKVGSASSNLAGTQLVQTGETRLINSMAGKTPGINIVASTGEPGAGSRIQIRGATSISGNLQPLIIVDGVPIFNDSYYGEGFDGNVPTSGGALGSGGGVTQQSRLNDINPADIESMEILRGASAAAIWGSRAANGVIVITTKKGKLDPSGQKVNVNVQSSVSIDQINRRVPLQTEYGNGFDQYYFQGTSLSWGDKISDRSGGADDEITDPTDPGYLGFFTTYDDDGNPTGNKYYQIEGADPYDSDGDGVFDKHGGKNSTDIYDPYEQFFKNGTTFDNTVSISAADNNGNVYFSVSDMRQDGIILDNSKFQRNTARLNTTRYLSDKWSINSNMSYTQTRADRVQMGSNLNGLFLGGLRSAADFNDADYWGVYTDAGGNEFANRQRAYRNPIGRNTNSIYDNPFFIINNIKSESVVDRVVGKFEVSYDVNSWLNIIWRNGLDFYNDKREDFFPVQAAGGNNGGRFTNESIKSIQVNSDLIARAKWSLNDNIKGLATLGTNLNKRTLDDQGTTVRSFINPFAPPNATNANTVNAHDYATEVATQSVYAALNAELYDQLFLNFTMRNDWLSSLPLESNTVLYPAVDVAWNAMKVIGENDILSAAKIRAGIGQVGRSPLLYGTQTYYFPPTAANTGWGEGWGPGLNPISYGGAFAQSSVAGNPDLRPEIKTEWEVGTDLRFLDNRINASFTYYSNVTKDLIIQVDVPESSGFLTQIANAAQISNRGFEIELGADVLKTDDFVWNIYGNYTQNRNNVDDMAGTESILLSGFSGGSSRAVLDNQLGVLWGGKWAVDSVTGDQILDANGFPTLAAEAGIIGDPNPDFRAGLGTQFTYKGAFINFLFDFSRGMDMWNGTKGALTFFGRSEITNQEVTLTSEQATTLLNYVGATAAQLYPHLENSDGTYTIRGEIRDFGGGDVLVDEYYYYVGPGSGFTGPEEEFVEDGSWSRLREVSIGYTLNSEKFKEKTKLGSVTFSFTGRNLLLWTSYEGNDPDQSLSGAGLNGFGLDYFQNPSTKSYMFAVNLNF